MLNNKALASTLTMACREWLAAQALSLKWRHYAHSSRGRQHTSLDQIQLLFARHS